MINFSFFVKDCFTDASSKAKFCENFNIPGYTYVDDFSTKEKSSHNVESSTKVVSENKDSSSYYQLSNNSNPLRYSPILDNNRKSADSSDGRKYSPVKLNDSRRNSYQHEYQDQLADVKPLPSPSVPPAPSPAYRVNRIKQTNSTAVSRSPVPPPLPPTIRPQPQSTPRLLAIEICIPHQTRTDQVAPLPQLPFNVGGQQLDWCKNLPSFSSYSGPVSSPLPNYSQYPQFNQTPNFGQVSFGQNSNIFGGGNYLPPAPAWNQQPYPQLPPANYGPSPMPYQGGQNYCPPPPTPPMANCAPQRPPQQAIKIGSMCPIRQSPQMNQCNQGPVYTYTVRDGCCRAFCSCLSKLCRSDCCRSDCQPTNC